MNNGNHNEAHNTKKVIVSMLYTDNNYYKAQECLKKGS